MLSKLTTYTLFPNLNSFHILPTCLRFFDSSVNENENLTLVSFKQLFAGVSSFY